MKKRQMPTKASNDLKSIPLSNSTLVLEVG